MILNYFLAQRKTDTRAAVCLFPMQALENIEDLFTVLRLETNPIVLNIQAYHFSVKMARYQCFCSMRIFCKITNSLLKDQVKIFYFNYFKNKFK